MKIAITFWGTQKYIKFLPDWYQSIEEKFLPNIEKKYFIFTDGELIDPPENILTIKIPDYGFPETFNMTFEEMLKVEDLISDCQWILSIDADMKVFDIIQYDDFFDERKKYIGVHHPCHSLEFPPHNKYPGSYDTNPLSNACIGDSIIDMSVYYQGCLWGGKVPHIFSMMRKIDEWTKDDLNKGIRARYYEESYLNKWFLTHKEETHILSPSFAFPELFENYCNFPKKIIHLAKDNKSLGNNNW